MKHPGTITFVEAGKPDEVMSSDAVPQSVAFYGEGALPVPVVRVVSERIGRKLVIRSFGVEGQLLSSVYEA